MNSAPWIGPAISTPSSVVLAIHLKYMPASSAAQLNASARASTRKMRTTAVVDGAFTGSPALLVFRRTRAACSFRRCLTNESAPAAGGSPAAGADQEV